MCKHISVARLCQLSYLGIWKGEVDDEYEDEAWENENEVVFPADVPTNESAAAISEIIEAF